MPSQPAVLSEAELLELYRLLEGTALQPVVAGLEPHQAAAAGATSARGQAASSGVVRLVFQLRVLDATLDVCGSRSAAAAAPTLLSVTLGSTSLTATAEGAGALHASLSIGSASAYDCCSDPGTQELVLSTAPSSGHGSSAALWYAMGHSRGSSFADELPSADSDASLDSHSGHWAMGSTADALLPGTYNCRGGSRAGAAGDDDKWHVGQSLVSASIDTLDSGQLRTSAVVRPMWLKYRPECFAALSATLGHNVPASLEHVSVWRAAPNRLCCGAPCHASQAHPCHPAAVCVVAWSWCSATSAASSACTADVCLPR